MVICYFCEKNISLFVRIQFKSKDVWSSKVLGVVGSAHERCLFKYEKYGLEIFKKDMTIEQQSLYPKEIVGSVKNM